MTKMKTLAVGLTLAAGLAAAGAAQAQGNIYVGAQLAVVDVDATNFDRAHNLGVYGGYNLFGKDAHFAADLAGGTLSAEGQVTMTVAKGDAGFAGDWSMSSVALFAAYRHAFTDSFYLKGKVGVARYDIDVDFPLFVPAGYKPGVETVLAAGLGAGVKVGPGRLEAEVSTFESDVLMISAGFHLNF